MMLFNAGFAFFSSRSLFRDCCLDCLNGASAVCSNFGLRRHSPHSSAPSPYTFQYWHIHINIFSLLHNSRSISLRLLKTSFLVKLTCKSAIASFSISAQAHWDGMWYRARYFEVFVDWFTWSCVDSPPRSFFSSKKLSIRGWKASKRDGYEETCDALSYRESSPSHST